MDVDGTSQKNREENEESPLGRKKREICFPGQPRRLACIDIVDNEKRHAQNSIMYFRFLSISRYFMIAAKKEISLTCGVGLNFAGLVTLTHWSCCFKSIKRYLLWIVVGAAYKVVGLTPGR